MVSPDNPTFSNISKEEYTPLRTWSTLVSSISQLQLEELRSSFHQCSSGLQKQQFVDKMKTILSCEELENVYNELFDTIASGNGKEDYVNWDDFLDFIINQVPSETKSRYMLVLKDIRQVPHTDRDSVVKIVTIESEINFCYVIYSKYGKVGIYDGNMVLLTEYHVIMTREDLYRTDFERRRRNRWITDVVYCSDVQMLVTTNTARSIVIYNVLGLKHVPLWLIFSLPNVGQCLEYKLPRNEIDCGSTLFLTDDKGQLFHFNFLQPQNGFLKKKHNDRPSVYYWDEMKDASDYVLFTNEQIHQDGSNELIYYELENAVISSSRDESTAICKQFIDPKRSRITYGMPWGASTFCYNKRLNLLITGSYNGLIRLWNTLIRAKPIAILVGHKVEIKSIILLEKQKLFLSCSIDGILKLWDIKEQKCIQTFQLEFECFKEDGKVIEWASNCIFPGPKRKKLCEFISNEENISTEEDQHKRMCSRWTRSNIWISCCNFLAKVELQCEDDTILEPYKMPVLSPPPMENIVLIPSTWKLNDECLQELSKNIRSTVDYPENLLKYRSCTSKMIYADFNEKNDINHKLAMAFNEKLKMMENVARGTPYLGLKLFEIQDLALSNNLPINNTVRPLVEQTNGLLVEANSKDQVFSELSSSRSKSSRSSVVDFE